MTIINTNSISGINSITAQGSSGVAFYDSSGSNERLRIDSAGRLAIGGNGVGSGIGAYLQRSSPATTHFYEASDGTKKMIAGVDSTIDYVKIGSLSSHRVGLVAGNGEKLSILPGGNIGIGVTIPSDKLSVYKTNIGNPTGITIRNTDSSSTYSHARLRLESQNGAAYGEIWADVANAGLRLGYNSASTVKIDSTGNIALPSGSGIDFSANSDTGRTVSSNVFDDYEEGTWTPTAGTGTITTDNSKYIKIGRFVRVECRINGFSNTSSTSRIDINGLPFTQTTFGLGGSCFGQFITTVNGNAIQAFLASTPASMQLYQNSTGAYRNFTYSAVTSQTQLYLVATYEANA